MENIGEPILLDLKELLILLIKEKDIHEGIWAISTTLGFAPVSINPPGGNSGPCPAGAVVFQKVGIQQIAEKTNSSIDAAIVNPRKK